MRLLFITVLLFITFISCDVLDDTSSRNFEYSDLQSSEIERAFTFEQAIDTTDTISVNVDSVSMRFLSDSIDSRGENDIISQSKAVVYISMDSLTSHLLLCKFNRNEQIQNESLTKLNGAVQVSRLTFPPDSAEPASNFFNVEGNNVMFYPGFDLDYKAVFDSVFSTLR